MNKVYMIEYQGRCDEDLNALGHGPKVLTEYYEYINESCEITVLAPQVVLDSISEDIFSKKEVLPCHIVMKGHNSFIEKIANKFHMFRNIRTAIKYADKDGEGILWFTNVEYYVLLYLFLTKKPSHKIYFTMFTDGYFSEKGSSIKNKITNFVKQKVFQSVQKKLDLIISTGPKFKYKNCDSIFIPDYCCDSSSINSYYPKNEVAVCLGTMDKGKQLEEMVRAFTKIGYRLVVAGRFYDKSLVSRLQEIAGDNITISDIYLSNEQYSQMMTNAKYTILPYSKEKYTHQTSGVMQEALFSNTIPVTYDAILKANGIPGIGFFSWDSLNMQMLISDPSKILARYEELRNTTYNKYQIEKQYQEIFTL